MVRAFETHKVRKSKELSSCLWKFRTLSGEEKGQDIQVPVPSCWETYPDTLKYRGKGVYSRTFEAQGNVRLEFKGVSHTAQYALIQELDSSRPRSSASCQFKMDICLGLPEVVSYNIYPKWYHETPVKDYLSDLYDWVQTDTEGAGKPFFITEIGAGAIYGYRTPTKVKWSEEYQQEALQEQIEAVFAHEACSGIYIWQFCDVRVCDSWWGGRPRTMNNKGIVDEYRRPKLAYETVKQLFRSKGNYRE